MENHAEYVLQKLVPDPFLILVIMPKELLRARNFFKNKIFWKRIIKKSWESELYFFLLNPVRFHRQDYENQKGPGSTDQSLFRLQKNFRKIPLLVMHCLT